MTSRGIVIVLTVLLLSACVKEDAPDFCKNHALFHAEHADASAELSIFIAELGQVNADLFLPNAGLGKTSIDVGQATHVFTLESEQSCSFDSGRSATSRDGVRWSYAAECGADNKLGQINVLLFDAIPDLDEVLVHVTTPVTEKHFAIHRQCSAALFRLE